MNSRITSLLAILCLTLSVQAQNDVSRAVGFVKKDCPAGSDTLVGTPFYRPSVFLSTLKSNPKINDDLDVAEFQFVKRPSWEVNQFANSHYARVSVGSYREGALFPIVSNTRDRITVSFNGGWINSLEKGFEIEIVPFWTLDTLFPIATQSTFAESSGKLPPQRESELLLYDHPYRGIDPAPARAFFVTSEGWFEVAPGFPPAGDEPITPWTPMVVRHPASVSNTEFLAHAPMTYSPVWIPIHGSGSQRDNPLPNPNTEPTTLSELTLISNSSFEESLDLTTLGRGAELIVFDAADAAQNKSPARTYFYLNEEWRLDDGNTYPNADNEILDPGCGFVIRRPEGEWYAYWAYVPEVIREEED